MFEKNRPAALLIRSEDPLPQASRLHQVMTGQQDRTIEYTASKPGVAAGPAPSLGLAATSASDT